MEAIEKVELNEKLEQDLDSARRRLLSAINNKEYKMSNAADLEFGKCYQRLVKAGLRLQIKKKYRQGKVFKGGK